MQKFTTLIKRSLTNKIQLESIRIGDYVSDEYGKAGRVNKIDKIQYRQELHYYFNVGKSGTIFIIL